MTAGLTGDPRGGDAGAVPVVDVDHGDLGLVGLAMLSLIYAWLKHEAPPPDAEMT